LRDIGNDFYELDEKNYCIIGHRSGKVFRLGDEVSVVIKNTDLVKKQIDFLLAEGGTEGKKRMPPKVEMKRKRR
jgi:ribonuclease R